MFYPEEEENVVTVEDNTNDYIAQIKNLKENSVSKDDYNKLKADNKKLIDALGLEVMDTSQYDETVTKVEAEPQFIRQTKKK